jgi:hypothetical protein
MVLITRFLSEPAHMASPGGSDGRRAPRTHIVSKAGLGATRVSSSRLPSARGSDGGGAPRSAVCRRQPVQRGRGASNTRPYNYLVRKRGRLWIHR